MSSLFGMIRHINTFMLFMCNVSLMPPTFATSCVCFCQVEYMQTNILGGDSSPCLSESQYGPYFTYVWMCQGEALKAGPKHRRYYQNKRGNTKWTMTELMTKKEEWMRHTSLCGIKCSVATIRNQLKQLCILRSKCTAFSASDKFCSWKWTRDGTQCGHLDHICLSECYCYGIGWLAICNNKQLNIVPK